METFVYNSITFTILNKRSAKVGVGNKKNPSISISSTFSGKVEIPNFAVLNNQKYIVTRVHSYAFNHSLITEAFISGTIQVIEDLAFYRCIHLKKITFEENSVLKSIGDNSFYDSYALEELRIPGKCLREIKHAAFQYSHVIKTVYIASASQIAEYAFSGLNSITDFYFCGTNTISNAIFKNTTNAAKWNVPSNMRIHVPSSYKGTFATLSVTDRNYQCPSQTCIKEYNYGCSCQAAKSTRYITSITIVFILSYK